MFLPLEAQETSELPQRTSDTQKPEYRLAVDVELVNVTATVLDESGKHMEGLQAEDFQIIENAQEQKISFFSHDLNVPLCVGVLLDISGSMRHKLDQPLHIVREIAGALSPDDEMFVITFKNLFSSGGLIAFAWS